MIYHKQQNWMQAAGQAPDAGLYLNLVKEECIDELLPAFEKYSKAPTAENLVAVLDAIADSVVVLAGLGVSLVGADKAQQVQEEVWRSNFSKFVWDGEKYNCIRREDGKILKGPSFSEPEIFSIVTGIPK